MRARGSLYRLRKGAPLTDYGEYRRIAKELVKKTPPQHLDCAIGAQAERMAVETGDEALRTWEATSSERAYVVLRPM